MSVFTGMTFNAPNLDARFYGHDKLIKRAFMRFDWGMKARFEEKVYENKNSV
ncbi:hypothetical protein AGMMS49593_00580 [Endomicrobiia bacterium]|nr:hypothetical protein AGMMS49593_00580 [Endomicrobiia bacterium]GHT45263.1 hypothetical protein AGMMS49936_02200 [Endomicrobiia bacterium]